MNIRSIDFVLGRTKMGKTRAYKHRLDKYYHLAHAVGYRSRAAFKLIQLNQQFDFLSNSHCCLDLCAAPGGWSQVAAKYMPPDSMIISIDLSPIRPIPRVTTLQADILSPKTHAKVRKLIQGNRADLILNDGAPNVGAAWITDSTNQLDLCLASVKFSTLFLRKGGTFVTKVFRSEHYNSLFMGFKSIFFEQVIPTKPKASRDSSAELFIVCKDYKAPTVIDPRLLDPQYVFTDLDELTAKAAPNAQLTTSTAMDFTECTVSDFLKAEKPLDILDVINVLKFDNGPLGTAAASHPATTAEIKELCKDIKVLGRADRKVLLKWRRTMREALIKGTEIQEPAEDIDSDDIGSDEEIKQALETIRQKRRKEEKAERKRREKLRVQLLKRLQKNTENKPVNADMLDPQIRYGKIYTPDIPEEEEDPNKTYEQIMEENIDYYEAHKDKTPISNDEDGVYIGPVKFARHVEIVEPEEPTQVKSKKWFSQSIFNEDDDDEYSSAVDEDENNDKEEVESEEVETEAEEEAQEKAAQVAEEESSKLMGQTSKDFDATAYKMAKELLLHPNRRQDIINDSFNKYLHDDGDIPEWFASDEKRYNRPMIPLSKDDVLAWRQHMRDINQVATKRVIEARARKKKKALQRMKSLQEKADEIAEKEGLNERSKLRIMERIFERGMKSMKPAPKVVVTQKRDAGRPNLPKGVSSGRVKIVDKRFKKDLRGQKASAKRTEGGFQRKKKSVYRHSRKK